MNAESLILQFATSKGGTFQKRDLLACLEGTSFSPAYISIAINRMVKAGRIIRTGRGLYCVSDEKREFLPRLDSLSHEIAMFFKEELPFTRYCIYEGEWINPFMHHIAGNHLHYLEVERDAIDSVFDRLSGKGYTVYLRPDREFMYRYVDIHSSSTIIIKPFISESPVIHVDEVPCSSLEKLLVDISKDPDFDFLQGVEFIRVLGNVKRSYRINKPRLLRYATRRSVREQITEALQESDYDID